MTERTNLIAWSDRFTWHALTQRFDEVFERAAVRH